LSEWVFDGLKEAVQNSKPADSELDVLERFIAKGSQCDLGFTEFNFAKAAGLCISRYWENVFREESRPGHELRFLQVPSIYTRESTPGLFHRFYDDDATDRPYLWRAFDSTVNMYGIMVGLDKIGHFLSVGRKYYGIFVNALNDGRSPAAAEREAIQFGVDKEMGIFGKLVSGVYSNADLATNYAGLRFYQSLFQPSTVHGQRLPVVIVRDREGRWRVNPEIKGKTLLAPFWTLHMNEALNPGFYTDKPKVPLLRAEIAKRCDSWKATYPARAPADYRALLTALSTWDSVDYGHAEPPEGLFSIDRVCY
jgi:hypothetical protein